MGPREHVAAESRERSPWGMGTPTPLGLPGLRGPQAPRGLLREDPAPCGGCGPVGVLRSWVEKSLNYTVQTGD